MNFQTLNKVEQADFYLGVAFKTAKQTAENERNKKEFKSHDRLNKSKNVELRKLETIHKTLFKALTKILTSFPNIRELPVFYQELMKVTVDIPQLRQSLGATNWAAKRIGKLTGEYLGKIKKCQHLQKINQYRQEYYGRISSTLHQIDDNLMIIDESRKIMKTYPHIKTAKDVRTVALFGFPNVGKSTILSKLTPAKPEIKSYAFTTKRLNLGYKKSTKRAGQKIQIIDTPGTLDRFDKMNNIEKQAYLALKHCAQKIIYVFDLTESSFPIKDQEKLYTNLKKQNKDKSITIYLSKTDLLEKEQIQQFKKEHKKEKMLTTIQELKKYIE